MGIKYVFNKILLHFRAIFIELSSAEYLRWQLYHLKKPKTNKKVLHLLFCMQYCNTKTSTFQPSKKYAKKISHHCNRNTTVSQISLVHTSNTKLKKNKALNINPLSQNIIISWSCLIVNCPATFNPKRTQMQRSHQLHIGWSL